MRIILECTIRRQISSQCYDGETADILILELSQKRQDVANFSDCGGASIRYTFWKEKNDITRYNS